MTLPPPKKGKVTTALRSVHTEQLLKLQIKHQQDCDFLEDIRNFTKMRATIEKDYAQALLKLATSYLQRKVPSVPDVKMESGESYKTVYAVWKTLLDETEKIAKARLAATEVYQQQVSESAKSLRIHKLQVAKKCFDNVRKMHEEIQQCVVEIDESKKMYFKEEHMAHDAREKAFDADEKLKRKKGRIFQSITSLQKNSAKFSFRKEACDIQATKARNDYVLALVAANAHQAKFYDRDLPELVQLIDCDLYDKIKEYILLIARTELLTCAACQSAFNIVQEHANVATMQYTMECYFNDNPVLSQAQLYEFEPCDNDPLNKLSIEHNAGLCLSKEARRWATCVAKETRVIRDSHEELRKLIAQLGDKVNMDCFPQIPLVISEPGPQAEIETRIDELRQIIRKAQTSKKKAEARLDAMREAGVNIEEWMRTSETDSVSTDDVLSRSGTVTSRASQKSYQSEAYEPPIEENDAFYDSDNASSEGPASVSADAVAEAPFVAVAEAPFDAVAETPFVAVAEAPFVAEFTAAEDVVAAVQSAWEAVDEVEEEELPEPQVEPELQVEPEPQVEPEKLKPETPPVVNGEVSPAPCTRCIALFSYQATNADELSFVEQEELELISEDDGDGWIKAKNYRGEEGYIPQNYVEISESQQTETPARPPLTSFSSVDYTMPDEEEPPKPEEPVPAPAVEKPANLPVVLQNPVVVHTVLSDNAIYCRATYDYEATCDEELNFFEEQIIKVLRKNVTDIDDGWWEGELDGKIGLFPSLVVEELKETGEPKTPDDILSPVEGAPPPAFAPPKPQLLILPSQVILTQPTPEIENAPDEPTQKTLVVTAENPEFHIELSEKQQSHYQQQFSASDSESSEHEPPVTEEDVGKYTPLDSSPDSPSKTVAASIKEKPLEGIAEEKIETDIPQIDSNNECPKVVISEAKFATTGFEDEFIYREEKCLPDTEPDKAPESTYQNFEPFECTFPDVNEVSDATPQATKCSVSKTEAPVTSACAAPESKTDQDSDVKMDINNDSETVAKTDNSFFQNNHFETTG